MPQKGISQIKTQRNTYTRYSIGCAAVWAVILAVGRRRLDSQTWKTVRLVCAGWRVGWTSATIARAGFAPPKPLTPAAEKRLHIMSVALIALDLTSTARMLATGKRAPRNTPHT